jgi:hypothetical protein
VKGSIRSLAASDQGCGADAGSAAEAKRLAGTIEELWRYPVKSMLGGTVSELLVTEQGGLGTAPGRCATSGTGGS